MLLTFQSKAAADVVMYEVHAKPILDLLHKDSQRGVITAAESASAIAALEQQIKHSKDAVETPQPDVHQLHHADDADDDSQQKIATVSFSARAYPLLEMLREAHRTHNDVVWGI